MAHVKLNVRESSYDNIGLATRTLQSPRTQLEYCLYTRTSEQGTEQESISMLRPFQSESESLNQYWQWQELLQHAPKQQINILPPLPPPPPPVPEDVPCMLGNSQSGSFMFDCGHPIDHGLTSEPNINTERDGRMQSNYGFLFNNPPAVPDLTNRANLQHNTWPFWSLPGPASYAHDTSANMSDLDTNSSSSPQTLISDTMYGTDENRFTSELMEHEASPSRRWVGQSPSTFPSLKKRSPTASEWQSTQKTHNTDVSRMPQVDQKKQALAMDLPFPCDSEENDRSRYAYSQQSIFESPFWRAPGHPAANLSSRPQISQIPHTSVYGRSNANNNFSRTENSCAPMVWQNTCHVVSAQKHSQRGFHTTQILDEHALRKNDDKILLEGKKSGLTYKEISRNMHTKCAESTLRGRYRSLTKARKDRVRKPAWSTMDMALLKSHVQKELDRIATHHPSLKYEQRLAKIQWKKAADYIEANGGSYHFGNSTCKRKWVELYPRP